MNPPPPPPEEEQEDQALIPGPAIMDDENDNDNDNDNNNGDRDLLQIQDETEWFRRYGLSGEPHYGAESYANQQEAKKRVQDQSSYQQKVHEKIFEESSQRDKEQQRLRFNKLQEWKSESITLIAGAANQTIECNLKDLASHSDTVFAMALSRQLYSNGDDSDRSSNTTTTTTDENSLSLSLEDYSKEAVEAFLRLVRVDKDDLPIATIATIATITTEASIDPDSIVDCCRIAHYLQCTQLLDSIVQILKASVDSANCMSICQLADQLHLPCLLEASLGHMMQRLGCLEDHEIWGDLTPELQANITAIKSLLQSSNRRQIFFSSFTEYLAMFAEQVDYYRERLTEAKLQQDQHAAACHDDYSTTCSSSRGWGYAQEKIDRQSDRVRTLQMVLAEQKKLFRNKPDFL